MATMISNLTRKYSTKIAVGVSGGVDSAVAALLLKNKGYDVHGVFMRNWDEMDETGVCKADKECATAEWVCNKLDIPFTEMNFVKDYWNEVFQYLLTGYQVGLTPNPDILCNKHIKFGSLVEKCKETLGVEKIATGHYARILQVPDGVKLLRGLDENKDQSFFLSQVNQSALQKALFPLGELKKQTVRKIAREAGLHLVTNKKESMGICFIGKRNFPDFMSQYIDDKPGHFIDIETNEKVGEHLGQHLWTLGQRIVMEESTTIYKYYVAQKSTNNNDIFVCSGVSHPCLFSDSLTTEDIHWVTPSPPTTKEFSCDFRFQHRKPLSKCLVTIEDGGVMIRLSQPQRVLTQGQFAVVYKDEECLGSAVIKSVGPSLYTRNVKGVKDSLTNLRKNLLPTLVCKDLATITRNHIQVKKKLSARNGIPVDKEFDRNYMLAQMKAKMHYKYLTQGDFLRDIHIDDDCNYFSDKL